jgi:rRNA maturation RNase YbeY
MEPSIHFFEEGLKYMPDQADTIRRWIDKSIQSEDKKAGELNIIFCSDDYLHKINLEYLNHDTFTDIITFDNSEEEDSIEGDLFISIERVQENARDIGVSFEEELARVMIHGVLHLIGYKDKSPEESQKMRAKEDHYLSLRP